MTRRLKRPEGRPRGQQPRHFEKVRGIKLTHRNDTSKSPDLKSVVSISSAPPTPATTTSTTLFLQAEVQCRIRADDDGCNRLTAVLLCRGNDTVCSVARQPSYIVGTIVRCQGHPWTTTVIHLYTVKYQARPQTFPLYP